MIPRPPANSIRRASTASSHAHWRVNPHTKKRLQRDLGGIWAWCFRVAKRPAARTLRTGNHNEPGKGRYRPISIRADRSSGSELLWIYDGFRDVIRLCGPIPNRGKIGAVQRRRRASKDKRRRAARCATALDHRTAEPRTNPPLGLVVPYPSLAGFDPNAAKQTVTAGDLDQGDGNGVVAHCGPVGVLRALAVHAANARRRPSGATGVGILGYGKAHHITAGDGNGDPRERERRRHLSKRIAPTGPESHAQPVIT